MNRFKPIVLDFENKFFLNSEYVLPLFVLYSRYSKYLDDDFARDGRGTFRFFIENIQKLSPFFWAIVDEKNNSPAGFVYLDNIIGNSETLYSAEINTGLFKRYWGEFPVDTANKFFRLCFEKIGLRKLKALVYPQNFRVKTLLKKIGFTKEACLKAETLCGGKSQDIEIYSIIK